MPFQKWLDQIEPQGSLASAASQSLRQRLNAVVDLLPLAAEHPDENSEHVHQLRVWCRRSLSAIELYQELLAPQELRWLSKRIRRIRRAAGDARDLDVLLQRYERRLQKPAYRKLSKSLHKLRKEAQQPIVALHRRLGTTGKLDRRSDRLVRSIDGKNGGCFQSWAEQQFDAATANFFCALPSTQPNISELHQFRIAGKRLRYTMELLGTAFPSAFRESLYPEVSELQVCLGTLNDHAAAADRLRRLAKRHSSRRLRRLIAKEQQAATEAVEAFHQWWTPDRTRHFFTLVREISRSPKAG